MKRRLSLLLAVVMILGSFTMAFAAEESAEAKAGAFLKEVGVLEGINGDLKLEDNLRRQDMVVLIARLHGAEEEAEKFPTEDLKFTDFKDPYYRPIIAWAVANELIEGHTPERFGFNENVTAQQYATVLLRALGYNDKVANKEGYAKALEEAKALGILENVEVENDTVVTRGQMAVMTFNALGVKVKDSDKTLAEKLGIEMPEPEILEVVEVKADNLKEIKVVFNKDVDSSVYNVDNYETDAGDILDITYVGSENMAILLMKDAMDNKEDYELTIDGVKDEKTTLDITKAFKAFDNAYPEVEEVVGLGTKAVKVVMSEPIKAVSTKNFKLDGKTVYGTVDPSGRDITLSVYKDMDLGEHELTVEGLEDYAGFKLPQTKRTFEVVEDKDKPVVEEVNAYLERLTITFNEDIDKASVSKSNVYWKNGSTKVYPESVTKIAGNKVYVEFTADKALPVFETVLYVEGFKDYSGNKMDPAEIKVKPLIDETRPAVIKTEVERGLKSVLVRFSKSVSEKDAKDSDNYTILDPKDNKQVISEIEKVDSRTYRIHLGKALDENKEYTLKIKNIKDNNKYPNVMFEYEGKLAVGDVSAPKVEYVSGTSKWDSNKEKYVSKINVFFNKDMDLGTLANPENYLVELDSSNKLLSDVKGEADIIKGDGRVVLLVAETKYKIEKVGVLGVKDTTGKKLENYGVMHTVKEVDFQLDNQIAKSKNTVELEFSIPVDKAPLSAFTVKNDGEKVTLKDREISGNKVILTVDGNKLNAGKLNKIEIEKDKVIAYDGQKLPAVSETTLTDKIAPSMVSADGKATYKGDSKYEVELEVKFDEKLVVDGNEEKVATDFEVVSVKGVKSGDVKTAKLKDDKNDVILLKVEFDGLESNTAFDIRTKKDVRFIHDDSENAAKEMEIRSATITGIEAALEDATLKTLKYDETEITLEADKFEYDITLAHDATEVPAITAVANNNKAKVVVTDAKAIPGTATVVVTSQNGKVTKTYKVNFKLGDAPKSNVAELAELKYGAEGITLVDGTFEYNVNLGSATTEAPKVTAVAKSNGTVYVQDATSVPGTAIVTVVAEDGETSQVYKINFSAE